LRRGDERMPPQSNARAFRRVLGAIAIDVLPARTRIASRLVDAVVSHRSNDETAYPACVQRMHARTIRNDAT
jgi:hypothetical protein